MDEQHTSPGARRQDAGARVPGTAWSWRGASLGAVYGLPGAVVALVAVRPGLALGVGVLPAAVAGLPTTRRGRVAVLVLGLVTGLSLLVGGVLASVPALAVAAIAALGILTARLAARSRVGQVAMTLTLPLVAIGFSYSDISVAAAAAGLMAAGSLYAFVVLRLVSERAPPARSARAPAVAPTPGYGIRLGAAGATAATIGFALHLDHVGWACGAALLVMRPKAEMQRLRSVGRILAVVAGAVAAVALVRLSPPVLGYAAAVIAALAGATAIHGSRWYVTPAFTTFLVFLLLLYADPASADSRLIERTGETLLGIGIAYLYGLALPAVVSAGFRRASATARGPG
jgi:Fusaric acid resistance protein-like